MKQPLCVFSFTFVSMPDHVSRQRKSGMEETKEDVIWQTKPQEKQLQNC